MLYDRGSNEVMLARAMELLCDKSGYEDVIERLRKDIESMFEVQKEKKGVKKFGALTYYPDGIIEFPEYSSYGSKTIGQIICTPWKSEAKEKDKDKINLKSLNKRNFVKDIFLDALKYVYNNHRCPKKYFYYTYDLPSQTRKLKTNFKLSFADLVNGTVQNAIYGINQYSLNGLAIDNMFSQAMSYINNYQGCVRNNREIIDGTVKILMVDDIEGIFKDVIDLIKIVEPHKRYDDDFIFENSIPVTLRKRLVEKYDIDVENPNEGLFISRVANKMMLHNSKEISISIPKISDFKEMHAIASKGMFFRRNECVYDNDNAEPIATIKARPEGITHYSYADYSKVPCDTYIFKCIHCSRKYSMLEDELGNKVRQCDVDYNKIEKEFSIYMAGVMATIHDYIKDLPDSDYKKFLYKKGFYDKDKSYLEILKKGLESMEECKDD